MRDKGHIFTPKVTILGLWMDYGHSWHHPHPGTPCIPARNPLPAPFPARLPGRQAKPALSRVGMGACGAGGAGQGTGCGVRSGVPCTVQGARTTRGETSAYTGCIVVPKGPLLTLK